MFEDLLTGVYKTVYHVELSDKQITTVALNTKYLDNISISFIFFTKGKFAKQIQHLYQTEIYK